jgi:hypothetical protein
VNPLKWISKLFQLYPTEVTIFIGVVLLLVVLRFGAYRILPKKWSKSILPVVDLVLTYVIAILLIGFFAGLALWLWFIFYDAWNEGVFFKIVCVLLGIFIIVVFLLAVRAFYRYVRNRAKPDSQKAETES